MSRLSKIAIGFMLLGLSAYTGFCIGIRLNLEKQNSCVIMPLPKSIQY